MRRLQRGKYIFPFRGTRLILAKTARISVGGHIFLNAEKYPHSRQECMVRLADGAVWDAGGEFRLNYGTTLSIAPNAHLTTGDGVWANSGTSISCKKKITFGSYVAMGVNVTIYDSDFHPRYDSEGRRANADREVVIGDHVWITSKSTVLKGARIGAGAVIGANSVVYGKVPPRTVNITMPPRPVMQDIGWEM